MPPPTRASGNQIVEIVGDGKGVELTFNSFGNSGT
jgi:hypothetical protein